MSVKRGLRDRIRTLEAGTGKSRESVNAPECAPAPGDVTERGRQPDAQNTVAGWRQWLEARERRRSLSRVAGDEMKRGHSQGGTPDQGQTSRLVELLGGEQVEPGLVEVVRHHTLGELQGGLSLPVVDPLVVTEANLERCWRAALVNGIGGRSRRTDPGSVDTGGGGPCFRNLLCIDTETTGLAGGTGTVAFMVGLGWFEEGPGGERFTTTQLFLTRFGGEAPMLRRLAEIVRSRAAAAGVDGAGTVLLSYNGACFDLPLLETRFRLAGMSSPLGRLVHLDLLHPVRRLFRPVWPDCRLTTAESNLLGLRREDDLPGSMAPEVWFSWVRRQDTRLLPQVFSHNRQDLCSLSLLSLAVGGVFVRTLDVEGLPADVYGGLEDQPAPCPVAVARLLRERGRMDEAYDILCGNRERLPTGGLLELARQHRRRRKDAEAVAIWRALCARGDLKAGIRLASWLEHRGAALAEASALTRRLIQVHGGRPELTHRLARLERKMGGESKAGREV